jgi:plasmid rolling circle replication initiator protein Rep
MANDTNSSRGVFTKRARAKYTQQKLLLSLLKLDTKYLKKYDSALYCSSVIQQKGNKLSSRFCNQRFCNICNRNRTAKLIKGYSEAIGALLDPRFLTLTVKNVIGPDLRATIRSMIYSIKKMQDLRRKLGKEKIVGIRKLEVTYSPDQNNYHPHFHFIVSGESIADEIIEDWLNRNPTANRKGQDNRPATDCKELFKYFTKLTSKSKDDTIVLKKGKMIRLSYHYPEAIDLIFQAIENTRILQTMGGIKLVKEDIEELETLEIIDVDPEEALWIFHSSDWVNVYTGELLSNYNPTRLDESKRKKIRYLQESL